MLVRRTGVVAEVARRTPPAWLEANRATPEGGPDGAGAGFPPLRPPRRAGCVPQPTRPMGVAVFGASAGRQVAIW